MNLLYCNCQKLQKKKPTKKPNLICIGLNNSGKTSILNHLSLTTPPLSPITPQDYRPTYGFNLKAFCYKNLNITINDCGGKPIFRNLWEYYYQNTDGIIFVIDSSDPERFEESGRELVHMLNNPILEGKPLLVLANKGDKGGVGVREMSEYFGLRDINDREWIVVKCSAETGEGVYEGIFWLVNCFCKEN